ncbi:MAG TPA: hypothetical protein VHR18_02850 [Solirubrobacterales bacterium]|jgi:hypothetical protein|nr:hypothetical protein [Solirubrobacterales bacterium]
MAILSNSERASGQPEEETENESAEDLILREIGPTSPRPDQIRVMQDVVGLKLKEIAYATGVSRESVRLWKRADNGDRPERYEDLRAVTERLLRGGSLDPILVGAWFRSRNRGLGYRRPLEAIRAGAFEKVSHAAESFLALSAAASEHVRSGEPTEVLERHDVVEAVTGSVP